jgi:hypothetical protein
MPKLTLTDIISGYNLPEAYNANNTAIENALENTLSRDGTSPNSMAADLDMDSNKIINVADGTAAKDAVNVSQLEAVALGTLATNKVIDHSTVSIVAGTGLTGGGDITTSRTLNVSLLGLEFLLDPAADRIAFWDDSAGTFAWLTVGSGLSITGTTLTAAGGGTATWGGITGTLSDQTDLQTALDGKQDVVAGVDSTEIGYLNGVTSAIQTQLNGKEATLNADQKRKITISSSGPSGGSDGDIWFEYTP